MLVPKNKLCEILEILPATLDRWITKHKCPYESKPEGLGRGRRGRGVKGQRWEFNVRAVVNWMIDREVTEAVGKVTTVSDTKDPAVRLQQAKADRAEVELAKVLGQYAAVEDFQTGLSGVITAAKSKFRAVGPKLAERLAVAEAPAECSSIVQAEVDQILQELASVRLEVKDGRLRMTSAFKASEEEWEEEMRKEEEEAERTNGSDDEEETGDTA